MALVFVIIELAVMSMVCLRVCALMRIRCLEGGVGCVGTFQLGFPILGAMLVPALSVLRRRCHAAVAFDTANTSEDGRGCVEGCREHRDLLERRRFQTVVAACAHRRRRLAARIGDVEGVVVRAAASSWRRRG